MTLKRFARFLRKHMKQSPAYVPGQILAAQQHIRDQEKDKLVEQRASLSPAYRRTRLISQISLLYIAMGGGAAFSFWAYHEPIPVAALIVALAVAFIGAIIWIPTEMRLRKIRTNIKQTTDGKRP